VPPPSRNSHAKPCNLDSNDDPVWYGDHFEYQGGLLHSLHTYPIVTEPGLLEYLTRAELQAMPTDARGVFRIPHKYQLCTLDVRFSMSTYQPGRTERRRNQVLEALASSSSQPSGPSRGRRKEVHSGSYFFESHKSSTKRLNSRTTTHTSLTPTHTPHTLARELSSLRKLKNGAMRTS
jgi:hypothetical protein